MRKIVDLILFLKNLEKNCRSKILRKDSTLDSSINHVKIFESKREHVITYEKHGYLNTKNNITFMENKA